MRLSRTIAYAIHATLYLARSDPGVAIPCSEMARAGKMPERFLLQVLRSLVTHGVLQSSRGVDGGYSLARAPERITLLEIIDAFDNPTSPELPRLDEQPEAVHDLLRESLCRASRAARDELHGLTMAELVMAESSVRAIDGQTTDGGGGALR